MLVQKYSNLKAISATQGCFVYLQGKCIDGVDINLNVLLQVQESLQKDKTRLKFLILLEDRSL